MEGTSERDSSSLISLIEAWVRGGGASLIMTGVLMTVDSHCSVAISSPNEPECSTDMPAVERSSDKESVQVSDAIIGGIVAVVIVLIITIAVMTIIILVLRNRHGEVTPKNISDKKYMIVTCVSLSSYDGLAILHYHFCSIV
jgi:hypothetical protein